MSEDNKSDETIYTVEADWKDPSPIPGVTYSGRFNLRISQDMHERLRKVATREKRSLNAQVVWFLENGLEEYEKARG